MLSNFVVFINVTQVLWKECPHNANYLIQHDFQNDMYWSTSNCAILLICCTLNLIFGKELDLSGLFLDSKGVYWQNMIRNSSANQAKKS